MNERRAVKSLFQTALILLTCVTAVLASSGERWLHIRVETTKGVSAGVNINVPLAMAESVIPSIPADRNNHGKFNLQATVNGADFRAMLEAIRHSPNGVYVTVRRENHEVGVAKSKGDLLIRFTVDSTPERPWTKTVAVRVPIRVVRAMLTDNSDQLDVARGIKALAHAGDIDVTITGPKEIVRVWTDTQNVSD